MAVKSLNICMLPGIRSPHMRIAPQVGICSYLADFGHSVIWVISSERKRELQHFFLNGVEVCAIPDSCCVPGNSILAKIFREILGAIGRMRFTLKIFKERKFDIILSRNNIFDELIAVYIKKRYKAPFVLVLSNPIEQEQESFKTEPKSPRFLYYAIIKFNEFVLTHLLHQADLILPISKWLKEHLVKQGIGESRMMPVPDGIEIRAFSNRDGRGVREKYHLSDSKVIVYVGVMDKPRQLDTLVRAFSRIKKYEKNIKLLMVGKGSDEDDLKALANERGVKEDVIFTGEVPQSEVPDFIAAADIGISPVPPLSFYKLSSPIKLFEYMAIGIPVVANEEIFEHKEVIEQSGGGILVPFTPEAFADAMIELLNNPEEAANMGWRGRRWVLKNRSYGILARQVEARYFKFLECL